MANFSRNQLNANSDSHLDKSSVVSILAYAFFFNGQLSSIIRIALIFELASKRTKKCES